MANITIGNLSPAGSELFFDSESYMKEMSEGELTSINGGSFAVCVVAGVAVGVAISKRFC